jgi:hypothetical protein
MALRGRKRPFAPLDGVLSHDFPIPLHVALLVRALRKTDVPWKPVGGDVIFRLPGRPVVAVCEIPKGRFVETKPENLWLDVRLLWSNPDGGFGSAD